MTRSDFQKNYSLRPIPNLAWNTARKVYPCTGDFEDLGTDPSLGRNALAARKTRTFCADATPLEIVFAVLRAR